MSKNTLYDHIWDAHKVATLPTGQDQIFIGLHLIHEVTSPQAFARITERKKRVLFPHRTFATVDHIIPTNEPARPFRDPQAERMICTLEQNIKTYGIQFFDKSTGKQGIVHVVGPELGLTQPGMTICCGDSHTSSHGALGSIAFGIGTTQVSHVLETQTIAMNRLKVRRINVNGKLTPGLYPKDVILKIIQQLGVKGGIGYAYEYGGDIFDSMSMEGRLTVCNMSIEGGARIGYVNPDEITFNYLKGREFSPQGAAFDQKVQEWRNIASKNNAEYDDCVSFNTNTLSPMVTWGINPGQSVEVTESIPTLEMLPDEDRSVAEEAYAHMKLTPGTPVTDIKIDVVFIGSCTNSRIEDLRDASAILAGKQISPHVKAIVVPGSQQVKQQAEKEGLDQIFTAAGIEWRDAGCSMCLAMNPDQLIGDQVCASTSNRNFIGRQGSPTGRTLLMSPAMAAAAAIYGTVTDVRELL
jgi:3-isopropylmalate/(R)-2-methylmalate dehydratase large subunit